MNFLYIGESLGIAVVQIVVGVTLALFSITLSLNLLDKLTSNLDQIAELKKGNIAVGIYVAGILVAVASVIGQGAAGIARAFLGGKCAIADLVGGLIQLFIGLPLAIFSITLAQREIYRFFAHKMSGKMETFYINTELKNGNIAIAAMLFGAFYATSAVISQAVSFLSQPIVAALSQM